MTKFCGLLVFVILGSKMVLCQNDCGSIFLPQSDGFYEENPTYIDETKDNFKWQFSSPKSQGIKETILNNGLNVLKTSNSIFSMLVLRNNFIVAEEYYNKSDSNHSNNIHSASKSILSSAVGLAIEKGIINNLNQSIADFFPNSSAFINNPEKKKITIEHLLNMTSGLDWTEDETEYNIEKKTNWIEAILSLSLKHSPGTTFNYSTGNTHLLSAILEFASSNGACEFAIDNLVKPLGITIEHWGRDPQKIFSGGYNFYATPREMAKFGMLYLNNGKWLNNQIVPSNWVEACLKNQVVDGGGYYYGYCWWNTSISGFQVHKAWGYGGQFICLIPKLNIIVISSSDTKNKIDPLDIDAWIKNYIIPAIDPSSVKQQNLGQNLEMKVYPNPSNDIVNFTFINKDFYSKNLKIEISTPSSQNLILKKEPGHNFRLKTRGLSNGIYFYKIIDENKIISKGKFIVNN